MIRHKQFKKIISSILSLVILICLNARASSMNDSWGVVRHEFRLNHELNHIEVQTQIQWLLKHRKYLNKLTQAEPYIYHIITEIQKRNLPGELALIPMLESSYNPFAYSGAGAAGLWQLMPKTGQYLGVKGDWWVDGRRSIHSSTNAALNYLSYLHRFFHGDWLLAIAAYDCGEGTVNRQKKAHLKSEQSFWYLELPHETSIYVPRLLALSEIIAHPERYNIRLPYVAHQPFFREVVVNTQLDLTHVAKLAGISFKDLIKLNPGFNHAATSPNQLSKILIPSKNATQFSNNLARLPQTRNATSFEAQLVKKGEPLSNTGNQHYIKPVLLSKMNHLKSPELIKGQKLLFPNTLISHQSSQSYAQHKPVPIAPINYKILHIVQKNETFSSLEKKYQITAAELKYWNQMKNHSLKPGQRLIIWRKTNGTPFYIVKYGDTLNQIAKNFRLSKEQLAHLNPKIKNHLIHPGDKLRIV